MPCEIVRRCGFGVTVRFAAAVAACAVVTPAHAQRDTSVARWLTTTAGSDEERYLRALQIAGVVPPHQWSLRPFDFVELRTIVPRGASHPWARAMAARSGARSAPRRDGIVTPLTPAARVVVNSAFPLSINDGAVWAGRGATVAVSGGAFARFGPLSLRVEPTAFVAQNASFTLMPTGLDGDGRFADPIEPLAVDAPQRFGDGRYARLDPGQTTLRLDLPGVTVGASTANEVWGPAAIDPLLLGTNAAGIPRLFVGTDRPRSWGGGEVHVRVEAGRLQQSRFATTAADSGARLMAGIVGVVTVRGLPGLELGGARFFHRATTGHGVPWNAFRIPFEQLLKDRLPGKDEATSDNQLASLFVRWAVPAAGLEVYGEYGRNDHSGDVRDLAVEPDHDAAYMLGFQHATVRGGSRLLVVRGEVMNARFSHLDRVRGQARWNQHSAVRQGHTQYGELLGSAAGLGGSAGTVAVDLYRPDGRWTFELARRVRQTPLSEGAPSSQIDVFHLLRAERALFTSRGDLTLGAALVAELNRDFVRDAYGVRLDAGWRLR